MREFLEQNEPPHIVFAANDRMALGARLGLIESGTTGKLIEVYGFDFIEEIQTKLRDPNEPFIRGSIRQDTSTIAYMLGSLVEKIIDAGDNAWATEWTIGRASAFDETWIRFEGDVEAPNCVPPFDRHARDKTGVADENGELPPLWVNTKTAEKIEGSTRASRIRSDSRYASKRDDKLGQIDRIEGQDDNGKFVIDIDGRMCRFVKGAGWQYLVTTLVLPK
jgi:hypothetical protein